MTNKGPYLQPLKREDVPDLEPTFKAMEDWLGFLPNDLLTMARLPMITAAFSQFCYTLMDEATLSPQLLYLVTLMASATSGCRYCMAHTANKSNELGMDAQKVDAIWEFETSPLFDERERLALGFAFKAAQSPSTLEQSDFDDMATCFTETEVCEIVFIVAQMGFWNRWNDSVATTIEATPLAFCKANLSQDHWEAGKHDE